MTLSEVPSDRRPTMHDVARDAGVSLKTVSRVVNGEPGVTPRMLAKVQASITALGFSRNQLARSLRPGQRSTMVGLLIGDVCNPFYSRLTRAVDEVSREAGRMVLLVTSEEDPEVEQRLIQELCERRVDGLIVVPSGRSHAYLQAEIARGLGVVFVDRPSSDVDVDTVLVDNRAGAALGVRHLLAQGHRRVAFVGDRPGLYTAVERREGYRDALAEAGIAHDPALEVMGVSDAAQAREVVATLLAGDDPPTAVFTGNNLITLGALQAMHEHGGSVALVGFDDFEFAELLPLPVTVVTRDSADLGRVAAEMLLGRLDGDTGPGRTVTLEVQLLPRGSGEIPPPSATTR